MGFIILTVFGIVLVLSVFDVFSDKPLDYQIYRSGQGWGYDIVSKNRKVIHQPHIPTFPGSKAFPTRRCAVAAARNVIGKIDRGEFPTFSRGEIDSLLMLCR